MKQRRREERRQVLNEAYYDRRKKEIISRTNPFWLHIDKGDVLVDSRGEGIFQQ